jgi:GrpE
MTRFISLFKLQLPWIQCDNEAHSLALQVESKVKALNGLPSSSVDSAPNDITSILKSVSLLLGRFSEKYEREKTKLSQSTIAVQDINQGEQLNEFVEPKSIDGFSERAKILEESASKAEPSPPFIMESEPEPSATAKELIKLRDYVLLACGENSESDRKIFESLYRKIGQILLKEGITALENTEKFNYELQQVIDTQVTDDLALDEMISSTVRPGYLFNQRLVRPQEVIVYTYRPYLKEESEVT